MKRSHSCSCGVLGVKKEIAVKNSLRLIYPGGRSCCGVFDGILRSDKCFELRSCIPLEIVIRLGVGVDQAVASVTHEQFDKDWLDSRCIHSTAERRPTIIKTPSCDLGVLECS